MRWRGWAPARGSVTAQYWRALGEQWRGGLVLVGCSVLESLPAFLSGRLVERAVSQGFLPGRPGVGLAWLAVFGAVAVLGAFGSRLVWHRLGTVVEPLRDVLVGAVVRGVLGGAGAGVTHRHRPDASGVARFTQHIEVVRDATAGMLVQARGMVVTTVAALAGLFTVAGALAWYVVVPVLLAIAAFVTLLPTLAARQRALTLADEHVAEEAGGVLTGMRDVVACGGETAAVASVYDEIDIQAKAAVRMGEATALRTLVIAIGGFVPLLLVLVAAPGMVAAGELTAGAALGALVYLSATLQPALQGLAATTSTVVLRLLVALRRIAESCPPPARPAGSAEPRDLTITLRGVTFGWGAHAEPVVRELDLNLVPGDHLAIVGPSGIGKSTLAGLLTGLLEPQGGEVLLGGEPVTEISPGLRHRLIAFTPQESYVFAGTVRENLALLAPKATDAELLDAALAVGAGALLERLGGLYAELGHAAEGLSAGEAQLLALVRLYASPAGIVVLDEATAHLDPAAEARAERAFALRGGVLVVIAHRLSSALRAGRVLVLDGDETLLGRHGDLLLTSPRYAELMRAWTGPNPRPASPEPRAAVR